jgi:hypothetical protein
MATMICVKHFMNILDIFFNSCFKNNLRKKKDLFEKFSFFTKHIIMVAIATYFFPKIL